MSQVRLTVPGQHAEAVIRWWPVVGVAAMLLLGWAVGTGSTAVDRWLLYDAHDPGRPRWMLLFTDWRLLLPVLIGCVAVELYRRQWRRAVVSAVCPVVAITLVELIKRLFGREKGGALAYPSGHTTVVVVVMGLLILAVGARLWVLAIAIVVSLLGALGMVMCGYHFLTDTIGGLLLGSALVCVAAELAGQRLRCSR